MLAKDILINGIDSLVHGIYKPNEPGAAVIAVKDGESIYRKGHGMANLELGVPIEPDMVFRLGSITKQFTAVAILMLAEQGKLALDDPITRFLPDYPTHDHLITVEHFLTHTSGIMNHNEMPESQLLWRKDYSVQELIDCFKNQPMQFDPGKRWAYNNSGYILLGAIIEKVSGQTYGQFIQQNIFDPLGMTRSYYDCPLRVIPLRASGYEKGTDGFTNADYMSMTQVYSAGALASTVDDLALWDSALYTEKLLRQETLQKAFVPYRLADGTPTTYGYGWMISDYEGYLFIEHSGGIFGFTTYTIRMPHERVFVAILTNRAGDDVDAFEQLAFDIATLASGRPHKKPAPVELSPEVLARYEGVYKVNDTEERRITREGARLFSQRGQGQRLELVPLSSNEFYFKHKPLVRLRFVSDSHDTVTAAEMHGRFGMFHIARKV